MGCGIERMVRVISTEALPRRSSSARSSRGAAEPWTKRKISGTWHTPTSFKTSNSCTTPSNSLLGHGIKHGQKTPNLIPAWSHMCKALSKTSTLQTVYELQMVLLWIADLQSEKTGLQYHCRWLHVYRKWTACQDIANICPNESTRQRFKRHCRKQEQTELFGLGLHPKDQPDSCTAASVAGMVSEAQNRYSYSARSVWPRNVFPQAIPEISKNIQKLYTVGEGWPGFAILQTKKKGEM